MNSSSFGGLEFEILLLSVAGASEPSQKSWTLWPSPGLRISDLVSTG